MCGGILNNYVDNGHIATHILLDDSIPVDKVQEEIRIQIEYVNLRLAPAIKGVIVITNKGTIIVTHVLPFSIPKPNNGEIVTNIIIIMEKCGDPINITVDGVIALTRTLAQNRRLACDYKLKNMCYTNAGVKLIDFDPDFFPDPQIIVDVNNLYSNSKNPMVIDDIMFKSMMLIFTMSCIGEKTYEHMFSDLLKTIASLHNVEIIVNYLGMYELVVPTQFSPFYLLLYYTFGLDLVKPTVVNTYLKTQNAEQRRRSYTEELKAKLIERVKSVIVQVLNPSEDDEYPSEEDGGGRSKRKTHRRINKQSKNMKTRRR